MPCQAMRSEENGCKEKAQWGIRRIKLGISEVFIADWCNGSTKHFDCFRKGSNPLSVVVYHFFDRPPLY